MLFSSALCLVLTAVLSDEPHWFLQNSVKGDKKSVTGGIGVLYMWRCAYDKNRFNQHYHRQLTERRCLMLFIADAQSFFLMMHLPHKWALDASCPRSSNFLKPEFTLARKEKNQEKTWEGTWLEESGKSRKDRKIGNISAQSARIRESSKHQESRYIRESDSSMADRWPL